MNARTQYALVLVLVVIILLSAIFGSMPSGWRWFTIVAAVFGGVVIVWKLRNNNE